jgi:hypothetical protein
MGNSNRLTGRLYVARNGTITVFQREDGQAFFCDNLTAALRWNKCVKDYWFHSVDWEEAPYAYKIKGIVRDMDPKMIYPKASFIIDGYLGKKCVNDFTPEFLAKCAEWGAQPDVQKYSPPCCAAVAA